jgi:hypothetical protein
MPGDCRSSGPGEPRGSQPSHNASAVLALSVMRTLYLRYGPDEVADRLERMAKHEGISVNAVAIRELAEASRRIDNAALLESLPNYDVPMSEILEDLDRARAERC